MSFKASIIVSYAFAITAVVSQAIYINLVPEYSSLSTCAQLPVSSIVRDMDKGCGDGGELTSYSCFCTASSSYYSALISTVVMAHCVGNSSVAQASSAVDVFQSYCEVGATALQSRPAGGN